MQGKIQEKSIENATAQEDHSQIEKLENYSIEKIENNENQDQINIMIA